MVTLPVGHPFAPGAFWTHDSLALLVTFMRRISAEPYAAVVALALSCTPFVGLNNSRTRLDWLVSGVMMTGIAGDDLLEANTPSPAYCANTEYEPPGSEVVLPVATPLPASTKPCTPPVPAAPFGSWFAISETL